MAEEQKEIKKEKPKEKGFLGKLKDHAEDKEEQMILLSTFVRLGILIWSGAILTLAYVELPSALKIPKQDLDPTFIASVFTGVLATFGVTTSKRGAQGGASGGVSKGDMEKLIAAASQTAPAQTIRIEQAPMQIATAVPPKKDKE
tara:strand:- start:332 stop:766 length:435 start_codon:yes stop_codon:yes gene_type:complete